MKKILLSCLFIMSISCINPMTTYASDTLDNPIEGSRTYDASYDDVWFSAIRLFSEDSNIPLQITDKGSGLIQTQTIYTEQGVNGITRTTTMPINPYFDMSSYVGSIAKEVPVGWWKSTKEIYNVMINPVSTDPNNPQTYVKVSVKLEGWSKLNGWNYLESQGTMEQGILDGIQYKLDEKLKGLRGKPEIFLGVFVQFSMKKGVEVYKVDYNSPAKKAGIKAKDIITEVNDKSITSDYSLADALRRVKIGESYRIKVNRKGEMITFNMVGKPAK